MFPLILGRKIDWPKEMDPTVKDLIDKLIQSEPLDRLGCAMTGHDMQKLMNHPFFDGLSFSKNLADTTDVQSLLKELELQIIKERGHEMPEMNPTEQKMSYAISQNMAVLEGNLLKKNKWFMKQERRFKLYATGEIKYYKGQEEKGCLVLSKDSYAKKISKHEVELTLNAQHRKTYMFLQVDLASAPPK